MDPALMEAVKKAAESGVPVERYVVWLALAALVVILGYVLKDYAKNHDRNINVIEGNTQALNKVCDRLEEVETHVSQIDKVGCKYAFGSGANQLPR